MALSPDNRDCAAGTQESSMLVWNIKSGEKVGMTGYQGKTQRVGLGFSLPLFGQ
jgi:hypothetical protein